MLSLTIFVVSHAKVKLSRNASVTGVAGVTIRTLALGAAEEEEEEELELLEDGEEGGGGGEVPVQIFSYHETLNTSPVEPCV